MSEIILNDKEILFLKDNEKYNINVSENTSVTIIEKGLSNVEINVSLNENSKVIYQTINTIKSKRSFILNSNANLDLLTINTVQTQDDTVINLNGYQSNAIMKNLVVSDKPCYYNTQVIHNFKESNSDISNVGIALSNGDLYFNTEGSVKKGFSGCKCIQLTKGIIMGQKAQVSAKPILLIDEYDVFAKHGAAIGKMSDEELFYLMSRGLTKKEAFSLILIGLINPLVKQLYDESLINDIIDQINIMIG